MNWRPYPYIVLAFFSRRLVQLMLLASGVFVVLIVQALTGAGPGQSRPEPHFRVKWEYASLYLPQDQRIELDRPGLMVEGHARDRLIRSVSLQNSRRGDDGRSIHFIPEPLDRDEMRRIVTRFPHMTMLKIWGHVSPEGWAALEGATQLKQLAIQDGTGIHSGTFESLPHLPALERVVALSGTNPSQLRGLGKNNPQIRQLQLSDVRLDQRDRNLPVLPIGDLTRLKEVVIGPTFEQAPGEQVFAKWDPKHAVLSKGWRYSPPSRELLEALKGMPQLERVYCCDPSAGDWGVAEVGAALGGRVTVEQGNVVRIRNQGVPFLAMAVAPGMFFSTFLLVFQSGATFSHELSRTVPNYARPHLLLFGAMFLLAVALLSGAMASATKQWLPGLAYALLLGGAVTVAVGGAPMQLRPRRLVSLLQWLLFPLFILAPVAPVLSTLNADAGVESSPWLLDRSAGLVTALLMPSPTVVAVTLGLGAALCLWVFASLPWLAVRLQEANAKGAFVHPFDHGRSGANWPVNNPGQSAMQSWAMGQYPALESPVLRDPPSGRYRFCDRLGLATAGMQGAASWLAASGPFFILLPGMAIWYRAELMAGDVAGGLVIPLAKVGLLTIAITTAMRLAVAISRRPYCSYEATLPMSRQEYHKALEQLHWRMLVTPAAGAGFWCVIGAAGTLWRDGGSQPLDVLIFFGLLGLMVGAFAYAAAEMARWAMTIRSDGVVMTATGILVGMPLMQGVFLTIMLGQPTGNSPIAAMGLTLGSLLIGVVLYVVNTHRYRAVEWGRIGG